MLHKPGKNKDIVFVFFIKPEKNLSLVPRSQALTAHPEIKLNVYKLTNFHLKQIEEDDIIFPV